MSLVRVVQASFHQIVGVVAVRHRLVAAVRAVPVPGLVAALVFAVRAGVRVAGADLQRVFFDHVVLTGRMVQVAVVQVVHMVAMLEGGVTAVGPMFVVVVVVGGRVGRVHGSSKVRLILNE